jgi:hypothetical protein
LGDDEYLELKRAAIHQKKIRSVIILEVLWETRHNDYSDELRGELFLKLFSEPYNSKKDYLLRNEFRLLSQQIENLLVERELKAEVTSNQNAYNYYLLRALQNRKAIDLFQKEFQDSYDHALDHSDYYAAHNITGLNFVNYSQFLNLKEKDLKYVFKLNDLRLTHLSCYYLTAFRKHQIDTEYVRSLFYPFSLNERSRNKEVKINFNTYENDYSGYLYLKAQSFLVPNDQRVKILEKCLAFVRSQPLESSVLRTELKFCLSYLANCYSLLDNNDKAADYYAEFFDLPMDDADPQRLAVLSDYIARLIRMHSYQEALDLILSNSDHFKDIEKLATRFLCLEIACNAFLKKPNKLLALLPVSFGDFNKQVKHFFKLYYSIQSYLKRSLDQSLRETENLKNSLRRDKPEFDVSDILKFFHRFYYILSTHEGDVENVQRYLIPLLDDVNDYNATAPPEYRSYLPFMWLKQELRGRCVAVEAD